MGDPVSLSCFANKVFDKVFDPIVTYLVIYPITALYLCKQNVMKLKAKLGELAIRKMDVQHRVFEAQQSGEEILEVVKQWMTEADEHIREDSESRIELMELERKARRKYCFGRCPNPKSLYDLSKKAEEYVGIVDQLVQKAVQFQSRISYFHVQKQESMKRDRGAQDGFVEFDSRNEVLKEIMKALQSPTVNMIGVHGMPGMGKTTLVKEVKRKAEEKKLFDVVVMAKVTRNPDLTKIQYQIARGLGMFNLPRELTPQQVADRINEGLKKMNALLILDDVWDKIDLEDLRIPSGTKQKRPVAEQQNKESSSREEQKECKVFITSRDPKVLSEKMGVKNDNIFHVNKLEDDEAWELFKLRIGDDIESSESRLSKAIEIVNSCSGLPLAIEKMAMALRGKEDHWWSYLLQELKTSKDGEYNVVRSAIEFSFRQLESEALKQTFLLCCLMGHNASIEDLAEYGTGLKLFPEVNKMEDVRDAARTLVGNLKGSSLLLDGPSNIQFDMQDAVRDAAISIASRDGGVLAFRDEDAAEVWPDEEAMKNLKWICLSNADISQLLQELELVHNSEGGRQQVQCPQLTFFHLSNKYPSSKTAVPTDFFEGMKNLRVLSLTKMHFSSMPQSISLLTNLRTLRLNQSKLGVLEGMAEIIGKLKNLQVLNLAGCDIIELPKEIACLMRLKLLDMSHCHNLKVISPDVLSKLSSLEELKMTNSFDQWQFVGQHNNQNGSASLAELKHLKLTTLEVCINDVQMIPEDLFNAELKRYKIFIGDLWKSQKSSFRNSKILKLELKAGSSYSSIIKLLKVSEELHLEGLRGVKNVVYKLDNEGFQKLRYLYVRNAPEIQYFIDSEWMICSNAFPILEELLLQNLKNMEKIYRELDLLGATSFNRLRIITIECCHQLKNLFSFAVVKQLFQLQEISLKDCENIKEIVAEDAQVIVQEIEEAATVIELGQVRSLRLEKLPNFISVCHEHNSLITDQGGSLLMSSRCMPLFNEKVVFPNLEELQISWINVNTIWHPSVTSHVQNLTKLIIKGCHNLEYLFSSSMVAILVKLKHLQIRKCKRMTNVIFSEDVEENKNLIVPWLDFLFVNDLQNLESFYSGTCFVKFQSLKQLQIMNCPKLEGFTAKSTRTNVAANIQPLFNGQLDYSQLGKHDSSSVFENLEALTVHFCESVISLSTSTVPFQTLTTLEVSHCKRMINLVSTSTAQSLVNLKSMIVSYCHKLTEIVGNEGDGTQDLINFTKLTNLKLEGLTKLASFCSGNSIFQFPSLVRVIVNQCPQLKKFCRGELTTPVLKRVQLIAGEGKWRWEGNLNTTIQKMYIEKDGYAGLQNLILSDFPEVMESWHIMSPQEMLHFRLIQDLKICSCSNFKYLLTPSIALAFVELKKLEVINCGTMEQVIEGEGPENQIVFPHLWLINLESCSDLTSFYMGSQNLRIPALLHIYVKDCPKMVTLAASTFLGEHEKEAFRHFFSGKVETPHLDTLDLCSINVQKMWHNELSSMSSLVQKLRKLTVRNCDNLKYLFTSSMVKSFVQLEVLEIFECQLMEVVILIEEWEDEERVCRMVFPKLDVLELMVLPQLKKFCGTCNSLEISEPQGLVNGGGSQVLSPTS